jgi:hypothetical protein
LPHIRYTSVGAFSCYFLLEIGLNLNTCKHSPPPPSVL